MAKKTIAQKTIKSTKFWPAVGTTVGLIGAAAFHVIDPATAVNGIVAIWGAFVVGRGIEDNGAAKNG